MDDSLFIFFSHQLLPTTLQQDDFFILEATPPLADSLLFFNCEAIHRNLLIRNILPEGKSFSEVTKNLLVPAGMPGSGILLVAANEEPVQLKYSGNSKDLYSVLYNVVGTLPGHSIPREAIIFSAHYDHLGKGYNGANDNASGTTAVLALAKYFTMRNDNARTLIFCLFAGEELGLLGSYSFTSFIQPENITAVINIEMIGSTNKSGKNAFFISGAAYSDLDRILSENLPGSRIKIKKEGADPRHLFKRSDNYPFALLGIPAHTIMCSDDEESCYHQQCDDVKNIDIGNMTTVIQAIAKCCASLINGKDTPKRINNKLF